MTEQRQATGSHSFAIREATTEDWSRVRTWAQFSRQGTNGIVGVLDGLIVAYLYWYPDPVEDGTQVIVEIEVQADRRHCGYGTTVSALRAKLGAGAQGGHGQCLEKHAPILDNFGLYPDAQ